MKFTSNYSKLFSLYKGGNKQWIDAKQHAISHVQCKINILFYSTMLLDCFHVSKTGKHVQTADLIGASSHLA